MIETKFFDTESLEYLSAIQGVHSNLTGHKIAAENPKCEFCIFIKKLTDKIEKAHHKGIKITITDLSEYFNKPNPIKLMIDATQIYIKESGRVVRLPIYQVGTNGLFEVSTLEIPFVKGDKSDTKKPRQDGITTEALLATALHYLESVNVGDLANTDTDNAIDSIKDAMEHLNNRAKKRAEAGTLGTYQK